MVDRNKVLITGGSGYLGEQIAEKFSSKNWEVRILDLNFPNSRYFTEFIQGDIRNQSVCCDAAKDVSVVVHAVAQVPLARNKKLFNEVNIEGTRNMVKAARDSKVRQFIYISSSAIYGLPDSMPVTHKTIPNPIEEYGQAKLKGEEISREYSTDEFKVTIIRPRTILGRGRLGIFSILFDWISKGLPIFTIGEGSGKYQFVHVDDLALGVFASADLGINGDFNLGSLEFSSLKDDLSKTIRYAKTNSMVLALPRFLIDFPLRVLSGLKILPFAKYQLKLYSKEMYFDCTKDWERLGVTPNFSNVEALIDSYDWYIKNRDNSYSHNRSHHQKSIKSIGIDLVTKFLKIFTRLQEVFVNKKH